MERLAAAQELGRLRWRCRRGMRELDELLSRFVDEQYADCEVPQQQAFRRLLDAQDPLIYAWLLGRETPSDAGLASLVFRITAGARRIR